MPDSNKRPPPETSGESPKKPKIENQQVLCLDRSKKIPKYRKDYDDPSLPFPAVPMDALFDDSFMRAVREEAIDNLEATVKNSDLYEKMQSLDIANIAKTTDENSETTRSKMPHLMTLYHTLQSSEFKSILNEITGVNTQDLEGDVDATVHVYGEGHHLLPHDDDVGSRRIAFIIYLTDPENPWTREDGGALELYPMAGPYPASEPSVRLMPSWNRMSIFEVRPNVSWHAVEEIRSKDKLRMSIQGWFHSKERPAERIAHEQTASDIISLRNSIFEDQAKALPEGGEAELVDEPEFTASCLSRDDNLDLSKFLDPKYLLRSTIEELREQFVASNGILILRDFLKTELKENIMKELFDKTPIEPTEHNSEIAEPPVFHRFRRWKKDHPLSAIQASLFDTPAFRRYITEITGLDGDHGYVTETRQFRRGSDYTLAVAPALDSRLDATYVMIDDRQPEHQAQWIANEVGGMEVLLPAVSDDTDNAAVAESNGEALTLETLSNSLTVVLRPTETPSVRYVKFLKSAAPSDRFEVSNEYMLRVDDESFCSDENPSVNSVDE